MDAKTFNELFFNGGMASACINLLNGSHGAAVRATLMAVASQPSEELASGLEILGRIHQEFGARRQAKAFAE